ncbi:MAG: VWA domain-containing protein [Spirochaetota bacterium]|nr:VWA domain-containing protein [Spirochaetota bacterium]
MKRALEDFITALRSSGVRISVSESIDAMNAVELVGFRERNVFRDSLQSALAKSQHEKEIFNICFDRFFSSYSFTDQNNDTLGSAASEGNEGTSNLAQMLLSGDNLGLAVSIREAARAVDITGIQYFTQKGVYLQRILHHMGLPELRMDIDMLLKENTDYSKQRATELEKGRHYLFENVRNFVEQQFILFSGSTTEEIREWYLKNVKLTNVEGRNLHQMQAIINKMVKNLNDVSSRRRKTHKRGQLDFKRTLRNNLKYQGVIFNPWWKYKKIDRPEVIAICDVSRSVRTVVRFLLLFIYGMNRVISKIRTFTFCSNLVEVSHIFEQFGVEEAMVRLQKGIGLPIMFGPTDYGRAFSDFKANWIDTVTPKTTVIILGDARSNYGDPERGILKLIFTRCKRLIWLNPEEKSIWGTGDSEMNGYIPFCHLVRECNTITHLEKIVYDLVKTL